MRAAVGWFGRALVDELTLWLRWVVRIAALLFAAWAMWTWWLWPTITAEIEQQREAVVADLRDAVTPEADLGKKIRQFRDGMKGKDR